MDLSETTSTDTLIDQAYALFLEVAADNLDEQTLDLFNQQFAEHGGVGDCEPEEDWSEEIQQAIDPAEWLEIRIGLLNEQQEFDFLFARMLINLDPDTHECHILWQPE